MRYQPNAKVFPTYEADLHQQVVDYIELRYRNVMYRTDFAAGIKMTMGQAIKHKRLQHGRAWPDLFLAEPRGKYCGLFIELKREGTKVFLRNGRVAAGHYSEQAAILQQLVDRGYMAVFAIGFDQAQLIIDEYMATPKRC